jgi:hypothetical protein
VTRIGPVIAASAIGDVNAEVYRNNRISPANTNAITVYSADTSLLRTLQELTEVIQDAWLSRAPPRAAATWLDTHPGR